MMMKRILIITVLLTLVLATFGAASVGAVGSIAPVGQGKSPVYMGTIVGDTGGTGKLIVNDQTKTYIFNAAGCTPGKTYFLYYTDTNGKRQDINSGPADDLGLVHISGTYTDLGTLAGAAFTSNPKLQTVTLTLTQSPSGSTLFLDTALKYTITPSVSLPETATITIKIYHSSTGGYTTSSMIRQTDGTYTYDTTAQFDIPLTHLEDHWAYQASFAGDSQYDAAQSNTVALTVVLG